MSWSQSHTKCRVSSLELSPAELSGQSLLCDIPNYKTSICQLWMYNSVPILTGPKFDIHTQLWCKCFVNLQNLTRSKSLHVKLVKAHTHGKCVRVFVNGNAKAEETTHNAQWKHKEQIQLCFVECEGLLPYDRLITFT